LAAIGRIGFALFCGVAVLAKGPVGLILPLLVVVFYLLLTGQWRPWADPLRIVAMLALFLGVCLPWYVAAAQVNGKAFLGGFLAFSNLQRFTQVIYDHPGPPWFYLPWVVILLFPWSLFLPGALARLRFWRWDGWRAPADWNSPGHSVGLFLLLWLVVPLAFFSMAATKLPGYILPILPAGALLTSFWFWPLPAEGSQGAPIPAINRSARFSGGVEVMLLAVMAVAAALAPRWAASDPAHPTFAATLQRSGLPLILAFVFSLTALAMLIALVRGQDRRWLWLGNLAGFLGILAFVVPPLAHLMDKERLQPIRQLARQARAVALPGEPLWVVGTKRYSTLFYGGETATFVSSKKAIRGRLKDDRPSLGLSPLGHTARLFGDRSDLEALDWPAADVERLAKRGEQELWRVRFPQSPGEGPK
jgi:4-amino-4-deoxy-L-arabinose transferase-like glycosyltransferase